jgi:hypothetical protein
MKKVLAVIFLLIIIGAIFKSPLSSAFLYYQNQKLKKELIKSSHYVESNFIKTNSNIEELSIVKCSPNLSIRIPKYLTNNRLSDNENDDLCVVTDLSKKNRGMIISDLTEIQKSLLGIAMKMLTEMSKAKESSFLKTTLETLKNKSNIFEQNLFLIDLIIHDQSIFSLDENIFVSTLARTFSFLNSRNNLANNFQKLGNFVFVKEVSAKKNVPTSYLIFTPKNKVYKFEINEFSEDEISAYFNAVAKDGIEAN